MAKVTSSQFLSLVEKSQLLDHDALQSVLEGASDHISEAPEDLAALLVERNLITEWHADLLLRGKYKGFFLGKYKLLSHIGTGGMSSVYLAEHGVSHQPRAIKVLPKNRVNDTSYLERFQREAMATARLDHPNVVRVYDADNQGMQHYMVMEYVVGEDLQSIVNRGGPLNCHLAADYIAQACAGLQHAHDHNLIHRDMKPANLLLSHDQSVIKLLDLGLALLSEEEASSLTIAHNENVLGTADYLAPEQALNSHDVDARADIYGLGYTFYFLLTGRPPFNEGTLAQRIARHQSQEPTPIQELRPEVPDALVNVCWKMTRKDRAERTQTASQVRHELLDWLASEGVPLSHDSSSDTNLPVVRGSSAGKRAPSSKPAAPQVRVETGNHTPGIREPIVVDTDAPTSKSAGSSTTKGRRGRPGGAIDSGSGTRPQPKRSRTDGSTKDQRTPGSKPAPSAQPAPSSQQLSDNTSGSGARRAPDASSGVNPPTELPVVTASGDSGSNSNINLGIEVDAGSNSGRRSGAKRSGAKRSATSRPSPPKSRAIIGWAIGGILLAVAIAIVAIVLSGSGDDDGGSNQPPDPPQRPGIRKSTA